MAKSSARTLLAQIFGTVVMTHGRPLYAGGRSRLEEAVARCDYDA